METNPEPLKEILEELFSLLESLETQSLALTQFLKDQGIATDEKLAPYLDRAGNASSVKWRAARARMQYLLSPVPKQERKTKRKTKTKNRKSPRQKSIRRKAIDRKTVNRAEQTQRVRTPLKIQLKIRTQIPAKIKSPPRKTTRKNPRLAKNQNANS